MDREQLIECITDGLCPKLKDPTTPTERELWRNISRPVSRNLAIRALDALTAVWHGGGERNADRCRDRENLGRHGVDWR